MKKLYTYISLVLLTLPTTVFAAYDPMDSLNKIGTQIYGSGTPLTPFDVLANIVKILLSFVGIVFVILMVVGGLQWMLSGGNEQKIAAAKKRITSATIGLVIIVMAYAIAYWVTSAIDFARTNPAV